jgi:hypothetical protein
MRIKSSCSSVTPTLKNEHVWYKSECHEQTSIQIDNCSYEVFTILLGFFGRVVCNLTQPNKVLQAALSPGVSSAAMSRKDVGQSNPGRERGCFIAASGRRCVALELKWHFFPAITFAAIQADSSNCIRIWVSKWC